MVPVALAPVPPEFDEKVRQPGLNAIAEMVGKPLPYPGKSRKKHSKIVNQESDIPVALDKVESISCSSNDVLHSLQGDRSATPGCRANAFVRGHEWRDLCLGERLLEGGRRHLFKSEPEGVAMGT